MSRAFIAATMTIITLAVPATAAEICGNGIDDDANLATDEGCYPALTTAQCENPLSCDDTGIISPRTGSLRYALPPDVAPNVPFGPPISFSRYYVSQYEPGVSAPAYRRPLGDRWGHTYASWLDKNTVPSPDQVVVHLPRGQDAMFQFTRTANGWDEYTTFQPGFHFQYLRQRVASPNEFELKMLTGEVLVYNSGGKLIELHDQLQSPNKVLLVYDGNGMLSTVTDASGKRRLLFGYTSNLLTSIVFQLDSSGWTTQHTTTYGYNNGANSLVTIGSQYAYTNVYVDGYLTTIKDGLNGNTIVTFAYESATAGKVVRIDTSRGMIGWEPNSSRASCSAKTVLYFHRANTTSCSTDGDCGTGNLCGGKTGTGATGVCFRAARCLAVSSPSEDVITTVTAFAGSGESCDGACLDAIDHVWDTSAGKLDLTAVKDPSNFFTVAAFNANGLPTKVIYGDTNSDPADGGQRELFLFYNETKFPGNVSEIRRKSDLASDASSCNASSSVGCAQTLYDYHDDNGTLTTIEHIGTTLNTSGNNASLRNITTRSYDPQGRLTQIDGPLAGLNDVTVFEYWSSTDPKFSGFLQNQKRKKDATNFVVYSSLDFDFWGNAIALRDPDLTVSCQTFDSSRNHLTQRREQMADQTDCTANTADLVTSYERDAGLRLTKVTRPDGSCIIYEYDTRGRLSKTKRRDDCNAASSGDREEFTYSDDSLVTKIEAFDAAGTVTKRQELAYSDSRRLEKIINPVNVAKWTGIHVRSPWSLQ